MDCLRKTYYGFSQNQMFCKGSRIFTEFVENSYPFSAHENEVGYIGGNPYLLTDKYPEQFIGSEERDGVEILYFKSGSGEIIEKYDDGRIAQYDWILPGAWCDKGKIIEIGDKVVVVENVIGNTTVVYKSAIRELKMIVDHSDTIAEIKKSIDKLNPAPTPAQRPPSLMNRIKNKFIGGGGSPLKQNSDESQEGQTRQFGINDLRRLGKKNSQKKRWIDADAEAKEAESMGRQSQKIADSGSNISAPTLEGNTNSESPAKQKSDASVPTAQLSTNKNFMINGEALRVIDMSENWIGIRRKDGSLGAMRKTDITSINKGDEPLSDRSNWRDIAYRKERSSPEDGPFADEIFHTEKSASQTDRERVLQSKEFVSKADQCSQEGYEQVIDNPFLFEKTVKRTTKIKRNGKNEQKTERFHLAKEIIKTGEENGLFTFAANFTVNGQSINFDHDGAQKKLVDLEGDLSDPLLHLEDGEGNLTKINKSDLESKRGIVVISDDGHAFIASNEKIEGKFSPHKGISQEDLLGAKALRIIRDEVIADISVGDEVSYSNVRLGTIDKGFVAYKYGDEAGVVKKDGTGEIVKTKSIKRGKKIESARSVQQQIISTQKKLSEWQERQVVPEWSHIIQNIPLAADPDAQTDFNARIHELKKHIQPQEGHKQTFAAHVDELNKSINYAESVYNSYGTNDFRAQALMLATKLMEGDRANYAAKAKFNNVINLKGSLANLTPLQTPEEYIASAEILLKAIVDKEQKRRSSMIEFSPGKKLEDVIPIDTKVTVPKGIKAISDKTKWVNGADGKEYKVRLAIIPKHMVMASHSAQLNNDGKLVVGKNENYGLGEFLQARERESDASRRQILNMSRENQRIGYGHSKSPGEGSPVVFGLPDGVARIAQGNGRGMASQIRTGIYKDYEYSISKEEAEGEGLDTSKMTPDDMLVRVMDDGHNMSDVKNMSTENRTTMLSKSQIEEANEVANKISGLNIEINDMNFKNAKRLSADSIDKFIADNPKFWNIVKEHSGQQEADFLTAGEVGTANRLKAVKTTLIAMLPKDLRQMATKDEKVQNVLFGAVDGLIRNRVLSNKAKENNLTHIPDLTKLLGDSLKFYHSGSIPEKSLLTKGANKIPFLDHKGAEGLDRLMSQEDAFGNDYRDPLKVMMTIALHNAMGGSDPNQFGTSFSDFADGLNNFVANSDQEDMFSNVQTKEDKESGVHNLAEKTLIENAKPGDSGFINKYHTYDTIRNYLKKYGEKK